MGSCSLLQCTPRTADNYGRPRYRIPADEESVSSGATMANGQVMNQGRQIMKSCFLPSFITFVLFFIVILPLRGFSGDHTGPPSLTPSPPAAMASSGPLYPTWWSGSPRIHQGVRCKNPGKCVECHEETATMDSSHALPCVQCHRGNPKAEDEDAAHTGLIKDPGDLRYVDITCREVSPRKGASGEEIAHGIGAEDD